MLPDDDRSAKGESVFRRCERCASNAGRSYHQVPDGEGRYETVHRCCWRNRPGRRSCSCPYRRLLRTFSDHQGEALLERPAPPLFRCSVGLVFPSFVCGQAAVVRGDAFTDMAGKGQNEFTGRHLGRVFVVHSDWLSIVVHLWETAHCFRVFPEPWPWMVWLETSPRLQLLLWQQGQGRTEPATAKSILQTLAVLFNIASIVERAKQFVDGVTG